MGNIFDSQGGGSYNSARNSGFLKGSCPMARKKSPQRRDWRMIVFLAISLVIVLSMILFMVLPALPGS